MARTVRAACRLRRQRVTACTAALLALVAVTLSLDSRPASAQADEAEEQRPFPLGIWRLEGAEKANPVRVTVDEESIARLKLTPAAASGHHGTYEASPYYVFTPGRQDGNYLLVSDGRLAAALAPVADRDGVYSVSFNPEIAGAPEKVVLSFTDPRCAVPQRLFIGCFVVTGSGTLTALPEGRYVKVERKRDNKRLSQTFGSVFSHGLPHMDLVRRCYDVTEMSLDDFQVTGCAQDIFDFPGANTRRYEKRFVGGSVVLPYGWKLDIRAGADGGHYARTIASARDLVENHRSSTGFNAGIDIFGIDIKAYNNKTVTQRTENMNNREVSYSYHHYLMTQHALVLDKFNVRLSRLFRRLVEELRRAEDFDEAFAEFVAKFGTHFAYATTFGAKGYVYNSYTQDQVLALRQQGVDIKSGMSIGISENVDGVQGGFSLGTSRESARENLQKLQNTAGSGIGEFVCIGGMGCSQGTPGGNSLVPVLLDLRPISDLLAPPFYRRKEIAVDLRQRLKAKLNVYAFGDIAGGPPFTAWDLPVRIALKADSGNYLGRCNSCVPGGTYQDSAFVHVTQAQLASSPYAQFSLQRLANGKYALQADTGNYLGRCNSCVPGGAYADGSFVHVSPATLPSAPYAQFDLQRLANGKYALQTDTGFYLGRCNGCVPNGAYPDSAFMHVPPGQLPSSPWAQWELVVLRQDN